jgi:hypothetical protein
LERRWDSSHHKFLTDRLGIRWRSVGYPKEGGRGEGGRGREGGRQTRYQRLLKSRKEEMTNIRKVDSFHHMLVFEFMKLSAGGGTP